MSRSTYCRAVAQISGKAREYILFFLNSLTSPRDDVTVKVHTLFRFEAVDLERNLHSQQQLELRGNCVTFGISRKCGKQH